MRNIVSEFYGDGAPIVTEMIQSDICVDYDTINGVNCFIILTTAPNDSVAPIHDRMPLLLSHEQVRPWLVDAGAALELLCSRPPLLLRTSCDGQLGFDDLA